MQKKTVKNKRRTTRRKYGTEENIRTVLEGLRGETPNQQSGHG